MGRGGRPGARGSAGLSSTPAAASVPGPVTPQPAASVTVTSSVSPAASPVVVAATVPAVTGLQSGDALALLQASGYVVVVNEVVRDDQPDGVVLDQSPRAGSVPKDADVTLTVSRRQSASFLADWPVVQGAAPGAGTVTINGKPYAHALWRTVYREGDSATWQYDLGRKFQKVTAEAGLSDDSASDGVVRYEFLVDGRIVQTFDAKLGTTVPVEVDARGGLRLQIVLTKIAGADGRSYPAIGDPQIWALPGQVATPAKS